MNMKNHESVKKLVSATLSLAMLCSNTGTAGVMLNAYAEDAEGSRFCCKRKGSRRREARKRRRK